MSKFTETVEYVDGHKEHIARQEFGRWTIRSNRTIINDFKRRRQVIR